MLKKHSDEIQSKNDKNNRSVLKIMFPVGLYMVKHRCPNDAFPDLMKLLANSGSVEIKKYLFDCPKNANYMSPRSYKELLKVAI